MICQGTTTTFYVRNLSIDEKMYEDSAHTQELRYGARREISDAWLAKFEQAYQKAKLVFDNSSDFQSIHNIYRKTDEKITKTKKRAKRSEFLSILFSIGGIIFVFLLFGFLIYYADFVKK